MKQKLALFTVILFILLFAVAGVAAQDTIPAERVDHNELVDLVVNTLGGLVIAAFGSAPITVVLVAILKKIPAFDKFSGQAITFCTAAVLYVIALIASVFGFQPQFESVLQMLVVVAPAVTSFITTLIAAPAQYHTAKALDVPVIGEAREPKNFVG